MGRPPEPTFHQPPATIGRPPDYMGDCNDEGLLESCCPDWSEMNHYDPMETYMSSDLTSEPATFMRDDRDIHFSPLSLE